MTYLQRLRSFNRDTRLLLIIWALVGLAYFGVFVLLLNLYLLRLGYDVAFIGQINALASLAYCLGCLAGGALGTRWGCQVWLIGSAAALIVSLAMTPLVEWLPAGWRAGWLIASSVLAMLAFGVYCVNQTSLLMTVTGATERTHAFAVQSALTALAGFGGSLLAGQLPVTLAPLLGATLSDPAPYRYTLLLAPLLLLPMLPLLAQVRRGECAPAPAAPTQKGRAAFGLMALILLISLLRWAGQGPTATFMNVYLDDALGASAVVIGLIMGIAKLGSGFASLLMPAIVAATSKRSALIGSALGVALSLAPLALWPNRLAAGLSYVSMCAFFSLAGPLISMYSLELVEPGWWPAMTSASNMALGLGLAAMSLGGGYAIEALGYRALFLSGALLSALGAALCWRAFRRD